MKISSDPGMVSALETWLRDTVEVEGLAQESAGLANGEAASLTSNSPVASSRDSAEGLLELNVWNGVPDGSRLLTAAASFQPHTTEPAGVIQAWADHIFQPLV
jgi:hypothetical protein